MPLTYTNSGLTYKPVADIVRKGKRLPLTSNGSLSQFNRQQWGRCVLVYSGLRSHARALVLDTEPAVSEYQRLWQSYQQLVLHFEHGKAIPIFHLYFLLIPSLVAIPNLEGNYDLIGTSFQHYLQMCQLRPSDLLSELKQHQQQFT